MNAFKNNNPDLDEALHSAYADLKSASADEEKYAQMVDQIVKLDSLKKKGIDPNTALTVAGNLVIAVLVIKYEQTGVIRTSVQNFFKKP